MVFKLFGVEPVNVAAVCIAAYEVVDGGNTYIGGFGTLAGAKQCADRVQTKYPDRSFYINDQRFIKIENAPLLDLGWENGWSEDPQMVKECKKLGHIPHCNDLDLTRCGLHHTVKCGKCGYIYHYTSAD